MGHRQSVHMLRIDRIEHDITIDFFRKRREEDEDQREKGNLQILSIPTTSYNIIQ